MKPWAFLLSESCQKLHPKIRHVFRALFSTMAEGGVPPPPPLLCYRTRDPFDAVSSRLDVMERLIGAVRSP